MTGKNTNTCRAITRAFWRLVTSVGTQKMCQNEQVCYCAQNIFMCTWCISTDKTDFLEEKSHKLWSKTFCSCLLKKKTTEKNVIVNKNILNKWKDLFFALFLFFCFFKESRLVFLSVYLRMSISRLIYTVSIEQTSSQFIEKYCLKNFLKNINFKTYSIYTEQ